SGSMSRDTQRQSGSQQITEAFPWDEVPRYLIRARDAVYGAFVTRRIRAMGHSRQAHCGRLAVANGVRRETDRHDPTGMPRPHDRVRGGTARTLRRLLIIGSSAVVLQASKRGAPKGSWLEQMLAGK